MQILKLVLEQIFYDERHLARVVPLERLLVRIYLFRGHCELLNRKGAVRVVPEDGEDDVERDVLVGVEEVGDCHLSHSEHTAPATIRVIVGSRKNFDYFGPIGHQYVFFVFAGLHFSFANQIY